MVIYNEVASSLGFRRKMLMEFIWLLMGIDGLLMGTESFINIYIYRLCSFINIGKLQAQGTLIFQDE